MLRTLVTCNFWQYEMLICVRVNSSDFTSNNNLRSVRYCAFTRFNFLTGISKIYMAYLASLREVIPIASIRALF